jgi:hypothetical protein
MAGIKESSEAIQAAAAVGVWIREAGKDGYGIEDVFAAMQDQGLRDRVLAGVRDSEQIPGELADADLSEVLDLVALGVEEARKFDQ